MPLAGSLLALPLALHTLAVHAAPDGAQIAAGSGSVTQNGAVTTVQQAGKQLAINWNSFNLGAGETVNFVQPSASALVVNRIADSNPSQILGRLNANGQVYLINPNGILFGAGAQVNVGALVASTLDLVSDGSAAQRRFAGAGGSVVNLGRLNAGAANDQGGYVALLGNQVSNQGVISARMGAVALGAGAAVTLSFRDDKLLGIQVDQSAITGAASNRGLINADGGQVFMTAGTRDALLASTVNNDGIIEARTLENHQGAIVLSAADNGGTVRVAGTLDVSAPAGGRAGTIQAGGKTITLAGASLNASGNDGAGVIDIGGGAQGAALAGLVSAGQLSMDAGSSILANGGGGQVVLWSERQTIFNGSIRASDGWVETSSHGLLSATGAVTAAQWLLDPSNVSIVAGAGSNLNDTAVAGVFTPTAGAASSTIYADNINAALAAGTAVTISTTSTGGGSGNITLAAGASLATSSAAALTLNADANIAINGNISMGSGALALNANGGAISGSGNLSSAGSIVLKSGLASASGTLSGTIGGSASLTKSGAGTLVLAGANTYTGGTTIDAGVMALNGYNALYKNSAVTINNGGTLRLDLTDIWNNYTFTTTTPQITVNAGGTLASNNSFNQLNGLTLNGGVILANGGKDVDYSSFGLGGTINVTANSSILAGTGNGYNGFSLGSVDLANTTFNISAGKTLSVNTTAGHGGGAGLTVTSGGTLLMNAVGTYTGSTTLNDGILQIGASGQLGAGNYGGAISLSAASLLKYSSSAAQTFSGAVSGAGTLTKDTGGSSVLTLTGTNTYTGATTVNAGVLALKGYNSLPTGSAVAINNGGTLRLDLTDIWGTAVHAIVTPLITVNAGGTLASNNTFNQINNLTLNGGTLYAAGGKGATFQAFGLGGTVNVSADSAVVSAASGNGYNALNLGQKGLLTTTFNIASGKTLTVASPLIDNGNFGTSNIVLGGGGTLLLNGANLYSGNSTVNAGKLQIGGSGSLGQGSYAGNIALAGGALLEYSSTTNQSLGGAISGAGTVLKDGGTTSTLTLNGVNSFSGSLNIQGGAAVLAGAWTPASGNAVTAVDAGASLSGTGVISATTMQTSGAGSVSLTGANRVGTLSATGGIGDLSFSNAQSLALNSITSAGRLTLLANGAGSDLTLNSGTTLSAAAGGNALTLSAGRNFINASGASALQAINGRWQIYTATPAANTYGGLDSGNTAVYNATYASSGGSLSQAGNRYAFAWQPSLTITTQDLGKTYGDDVSAASAGAYTISGFQGGIAHAFSADSADSTYSGAASVTSAGAAAGAAAGNYLISATAGSLLASNGYALQFLNSGTLSVARAALAVAAVAAGKTYDGLAYSGGNGISYAGFVNGDNASALAGTLTYGGTAQGAVNAGAYTLAAAGQSSANYTISYQPATLTIGKAALGVSVLAASKAYDGLAYGGGNGVSYAGFVNGETAAVLGGSLVYDGAAQGAINPGTYGLSAHGLVSSNYAVHYLASSLTVSAPAAAVNNRAPLPDPPAATLAPTPVTPDSAPARIAAGLVGASEPPPLAPAGVAVVGQKILAVDEAGQEQRKQAAILRVTPVNCRRQQALGEVRDGAGQDRGALDGLAQNDKHAVQPCEVTQPSPGASS